MMRPMCRVVLCVVNAVVIVIVMWFELVGVIPAPKHFKEVIFDNPSTNTLDHGQDIAISSNNTDPWDIQRTLKIKKCRNMITGVPELSPQPFLPDLKNPCWFDDSGRFYCLPYYYLIGMVKCGTSDLAAHIMKHPDIASGKKADQFWFIGRFVTVNQTFSLRSMNRYLETFETRSTEILESVEQGMKNRVLGDSTAGTLYNNKFWFKFRENCNLTEPKYTTADYIYHLVPKAKIIAILRNPTDRAYSSYLFFRRPVKTPDDFHFQVVRAIKWFENCLLRATIRSCAYNVLEMYRVSQVQIIIGLYYIFIEDYIKVFSKQQVIVIRFEDYIKDRLSTVKSVYEFLDLRPLTADEEKGFLEDDRIVQSNSELKNKVGLMRTDTRKLLNDFYRQYNKKLAILLGNDRYNW